MIGCEWTMKKRNVIIGIILLMSIGFAAVSTTLIINGIIGISENKSTYKQKSCLECSNYNTCKYKKGDDNYGCKGIHKK